MKSFTLISAVALAAGVSAQYSAAPVSMPSPSSIYGIPGGCNPAHPGSCPSSYFQTMPASAMAASASASKPAPSMAYSASAAPPAPAGVTTTITAKAGCPTGPAPDVMVTRSDAPVPSCEAGANATKPSIVTMPGYGPPAQSGGMGGGMSGGMGGSGNATKTGTGAPAQFTGAAGKTAISGALAAIAGFAVYML
ncbi:hypothetical protein N0V87_009813 [Didymella glomerata]|uniref:Uncharacterized protein n=1 Tax=Didymella glomerata TaxID=749621 RepID=A0A9W8WRG5_9PLEO|nr:hypothetical protein N0V87_009813 [Didymella glomerata]